MADTKSKASLGGFHSDDLGKIEPGLTSDTSMDVKPAAAPDTTKQVPDAPGTPAAPAKG